MGEKIQYNNKNKTQQWVTMMNTRKGPDQNSNMHAPSSVFLGIPGIVQNH